MFLRLIYLILVIAVAACVEGGGGIIQGSGNIVTQERKVAQFSKVVLTGVGTIVLTQEDRDILSVETDDNLTQYIKTDVDKGVLTIEVQKNASLSPSKEIIYHISVKNITGIDVSGAGTINSSNQLISKDFVITLSGAGNVNIDATVRKLTLHLAGSGDIILNGNADDQSIDISGSGTYKGYNFVTKFTEIVINGVGNAEINAKDSLEVDISGVGSVTYMGDPVIHQTITGVGAVRKAEAKK